jgi:hypothetical protein
MYIYTHIFKENTLNVFISEGTCCNDSEEAVDWLDDYLYAFTEGGYQYYCTYVENTETKEVERIDLSGDLIEKQIKEENKNALRSVL